MERINGLLVKLNNKVSPSLAKKLDELKNLKTRVELAKKEYEAEQTEENKESLQQIEDYILDVQEDIADDLEDLLNDRNSSSEALRIAENKKNEENQEETEEESSFGVLGIVGVGIALAVGIFSLGKLNLFDKK